MDLFYLVDNFYCDFKGCHFTISFFIYSGVFLLLFFGSKLYSSQFLKDSPRNLIILHTYICIYIEKTQCHFTIYPIFQQGMLHTKLQDLCIFYKASKLLSTMTAARELRKLIKIIIKE